MESFKSSPDFSCLAFLLRPMFALESRDQNNLLRENKGNRTASVGQRTKGVFSSFCLGVKTKFSIILHTEVLSASLDGEQTPWLQFQIQKLKAISRGRRGVSSLIYNRGLLFLAMVLGYHFLQNFSFSSVVFNGEFLNI